MIIIIDWEHTINWVSGEGQPWSIFYQPKISSRARGRNSRQRVAWWPFQITLTEERINHIFHEWEHNPHIFQEDEVAQSLVTAGLVDRERALKLGLIEPQPQEEP